MKARVKTSNRVGVRRVFAAAAVRYAVVFGLIGLLPDASSAMQQAFLVQNSGWMDAHYSDPRAKFKSLATTIIESASAPDDDVVIYAFNENKGDNRSPEERYNGRGPGNAAATLAGIQIAVKDKRTGAKADTNLVEAVEVVIRQQFKGKPGLLWILTNNHNSPDNSSAYGQNNRRFYELLHSEPAVARSVVFAVDSPASTRLPGAPEARGFMLYALAYGDAAARHLVSILASGKLDRALNSKPALLKPLDVDALSISLRNPPSRTAGVSVTPVRSRDGSVLWVIKLDDSVRQPAIEFAVEVENRLYPHVISRAVVAAEHRDRSGGASLPVRFQPPELRNLAPNAKTLVNVLLPLSPVPSWRELGWTAILTKMGSIEGQPTELRLTLQDQTLEPAPEFVAKVRALFPEDDPLLSVFRPPSPLRPSVSKVALRVDRQYSIAPLVLLLAGTIVMFGSGLWALVWLTREKRYRLTVDGSERSLALRPLRTLEVRSADGKVVGKLSRRLGSPRVHEVATGHQISLRR